MLIKKVKQIIPVVAKVVSDLTSNSETDVPSVKAVNEGLASIVETVTNENGTAIKFSDGTMICTMKKNITGMTNILWGNLYYFQTESFEFPEIFINKPVISYNLAGSISGIILNWANSPNPTTHTEKYIILRPVEQTKEAAYIIDITAIGRWK